MKKISNEVKVGATALITILVFIWLYNFLKGKNLFSSTASYYVVYDQIPRPPIASRWRPTAHP
jgi:phospholipid/cholesterol/gamma-HCH transport system substrate-binding protein